MFGNGLEVQGDPGRPGARGPGQPGLGPGRVGRSRAERHQDHGRRGSVAGRVRRRWRAASEAGQQLARRFGGLDHVGEPGLARRVWFLTAAGAAVRVVDVRPGRRRQELPARGRRELGRRAVPPVDGRERRGRRAGLRLLPRRPPGRLARVVNFLDRGWLTRRRRSSTATAWSRGRTSTTTTSSPPREDAGARAPGGAPQFELDHFGKAGLVAAARRGSCAPGTRTSPTRGRSTGRPTRPRRSTSPATSTTTSRRRPIGFTPAAGNFSAAGGDPVLLQRAGRRRHRRRASPTAATSTTRT